jgi:hypothetical protein
VTAGDEPGEIRFRSDVTVELVRHSAHDADVLFAARVSTKGEESRADIGADPARAVGLIRHLMRDRHGSPFEHNSMTFPARPRPDRRARRGSPGCPVPGRVQRGDHGGSGAVPAEPFAAFCDQLFAFIGSHRSARLVIDMRWNGGGNTFLTPPLLHHLIGSQAINRRGSLFVIIGRLTFSAAQNTVTAIERETHAIFVGEPTGSRPNFIGETIPFELPYSKVTANVADLYRQTSWPMDYRPWIAPDLHAPPTFEAYSQNRDPAMEAILASHEHLPGS